MQTKNVQPAPTLLDPQNLTLSLLTPQPLSRLLSSQPPSKPLPLPPWPLLLPSWPQPLPLTLSQWTFPPLAALAMNLFRPPFLLPLIMKLLHLKLSTPLLLIPSQSPPTPSLVLHLTQSKLPQHLLPFSLPSLDQGKLEPVLGKAKVNGIICMPHINSVLTTFNIFLIALEKLVLLLVPNEMWTLICLFEVFFLLYRYAS